MLLLGLSIGFIAGARTGSYEFVLADAQYKASILAFQLKALRAGKPESVIVGKEISLDGELPSHGRYMESHLKWVWPELQAKDDKAIRNAVAYRLANPYEAPDHSKPETWNAGTNMNDEFVQGVIEGQKIMNHYQDKVLKVYGRGSAFHVVAIRNRCGGTSTLTGAGIFSGVCAKARTYYWNC